MKKKRFTEEQIIAVLKEAGSRNRTEKPGQIYEEKINLSRFSAHLSKRPADMPRASGVSAVRTSDGD